jgi:hypothetical protein
MKDARKSDQSQAPGHFENQGPKEQAKPAAVPDLEERHQRTRDQAPTDTGREDRIRQQTYEMWEREGQPEGLAHQHWKRAAQEHDGEEKKTDSQAKGLAGEKPGEQSGSKPSSDPSEPSRTRNLVARDAQSTA